MKSIVKGCGYIVAFIFILMVITKLAEFWCEFVAPLLWEFVFPICLPIALFLLIVIILVGIGVLIGRSSR